MTIRHAAMEDLKAVTELEAKCFPAAEAAGRAAFCDRLASFPDHFWLLYEDEKLVSMINGNARATRCSDSGTCRKESTKTESGLSTGLHR